MDLASKFKTHNGVDKCDRHRQNYDNILRRNARSSLYESMQEDESKETQSQ